MKYMGSRIALAVVVALAVVGGWRVFVADTESDTSSAMPIVPAASDVRSATSQSMTGVYEAVSSTPIPNSTPVRQSVSVGAQQDSKGLDANTNPAPPVPTAVGQLASGYEEESVDQKAVVANAPVRAERDVAQILQDADMSDPAVREQVVATLREQSNRRREGVAEKAKRLNIALTIQTDDGRLLELQDFDGDRPLYYGTQNANAAISAGVVPLRTVPYTLDGSGLTVGVWDGGSVRSSHQELTGRTTLRNTSAAIDDHATHVAGTIAASGVRASAKGMAPNIKIDSYDWNSDLAEMAAAGAASASDTARLPISNHSYGYITGYLYTGANRWRWFGHGTTVDSVDEDFGRYHSHTRDWDALAYSLPYYTIFKAAGNDRTDNPSAGDRIDNTSGTLLFNYNGSSHPGGDGVYLNGYGSISFASVAKNVITIGAVHDAVSGGQRSVGAAAMSSFSSWGPTDDGRIKPDLVANGVTLESSTAGGNNSYGSSSGTSMASPAAAGAAALLVQLYRREFADQLPTSSLLKALLIHTADDLGTVGPNYRFGWGLVNAERAAALILEHKNSAGNPRFIESLITSQASTYTHEITWDGSSPIRVTLNWTDPAGPVQSGHDSRTPALVHNLDLVVTGPAGTNQIFRPYVMPFAGIWTPASMDLAATTGKNNVDNIEQVYIAAPPAAGVYTIRVSLDGALTRSSQSFSLVVTGGTTANAATRVISLGGDLSFGAIAVGQSAMRELVLQNLGNAPLQVDGLVLPTGFSGSWSGAIAPGGSQPVGITFSPTQAASYSGALQVLSDATSGINTRSVSGSGVLDITPLSDGEPVSSLAGTSGSETFFMLAVPEGQAELRFVISGGGGGDADLYVRHGNLPTVNQWDYRPYLNGSEETVAISNPSAGNWYVMIHGYSAYSSLTLTGSFDAPLDSTRVIRLTGDLAFGNIPVGGSVEKYATIHNDGNTALAVSGITLPGGYVGAWSGSIAPGASQLVSVTFTPDAAQVYEGHFVVASDKTAGENSLPVSGSGITDTIPLQNGVAAGPFNGQAGAMMHFFIDVPEGQSAFSVQIDGEANQADLYLRLGAMPDLETFDHWTFDGAQFVAVTNPPPGRWHIMLHALTQYTGIRLTATYEDAPATKVIRLVGNLDFGSVRVNESATRALAVFNDGNAPLNVSGISYPPGYSGHVVTTVPTNESRQVNVTFVPTQEGAFGGELVVQSDATSGNSSLALSGQGVAPGAAVPLESGNPVGAISGATGSDRHYVINVPSGAAYLEVAISGGSGDADLYVRHDATPTQGEWDYRPYLNGNDELAVIQAPAEGNWYIMLHGWEAYSGVSLVATVAFPVGLAEALDADGLLWETGGGANWFGQAAVSYDGVDAAQSGAITHNQQSWVQTTVTGPGTIRFWWKVSSEANFDYLRFAIDSTEQVSISGNVDWQQRSFSVPSGERTLRWQYDKDGSVSHGSDCGWVDQVSWSPGAGMSPSGGENISHTRRPAFTWPAVIGATWHQLWIQRNGQTYATPWQAGTPTWIPGGNGLPGGNYNWWVRGWGPDMGMGGWSSSAANFSIEAGTPSALTLVAPTGIQPDNNPAFRWNKDANATWYRLWVSHPFGGTWHAQWYGMSGTGEGSATVNSHPGGTSSWWMRPWGPDGFGPWSGPLSFSTPDIAPAVPTLVSPVGETTSPVTLQYESERAEWYRLYVVRGGTVVLDRWTPAPSYDLGALLGGSYAWWVGAWNAASGRTVWSARGEFSIPITVSEHALVGAWRDQYDEATIIYYANGTYQGWEFGDSFSGTWAPTSPTTATRSWGSSSTMYITLLNANTYVVDNAPSLGQYYRVQ